MRGVYTSINEIRRRVYTEIARMAYESVRLCKDWRDCLTRSCRVSVRLTVRAFSWSDDCRRASASGNGYAGAHSSRRCTNFKNPVRSSATQRAIL